MNRSERIQVLVELGNRLLQPDDYREAVIHQTYHNNQWFTKENQRLSIQAIATYFLRPEKIEQWLNPYDLVEKPTPKKVGIIMAGNIPLVGFHDMLCVFIAGHISQIKLSDKDRFLIPYLLRELKSIEPRTEHYFKVVEKLNDFDSVIATGSNNSFRYFDAYFGKFPNIIRKNRNAIAVLDGNESKEDLIRLGKDVFQYFGLGCRNVSKIFVPHQYDFEPLLAAFHEYNSIIEHPKYKNNFDYNYALLILNKEAYLANSCILLLEKPAITSRIASIHYEHYDSIVSVNQFIQSHQDEIQCIVSKVKSIVSRLPFGQAQQPELWDYADGVDTLSFLNTAL